MSSLIKLKSGTYKDKLFTPRMDGANEEIRELSYSNAKTIW